MENNTNIQPATSESVWVALRELAARQAETDRQIKKVSKTLVSWANNHGRFAEEYFFISFEKGKQNFFGEKFDDIDNGVKGIEKGVKDEYDILMTNGHSVGIVEVKFKVHETDIPTVLNKVNTFHVNFLKYSRHRVNLGLATLSFYPELEEACIKQVGEKVVINDKPLKAF